MWRFNFNYVYFSENRAFSPIIPRIPNFYFIVSNPAYKKTDQQKSISYVCSKNRQTDSEGSGPVSDKQFAGVLPDPQDILNQRASGKDPYLTFIKVAGDRAITLLAQNPNYYTEVHHITPRFEGGLDEPDNLVRLTYDDHVIAHFIRWITYESPNDYVAYRLMSGQDVDARRARASLGGKIGGPKAQAQNKERGAGWFDRIGQMLRGQKGAAVNREQATGAFDPENLAKANKALALAKAKNPEKYTEQNLKNLERGRQTQKDLGINIGDPINQRRTSLLKWGIWLNGKRYYYDTEQRTHVCETTFEYYVRYAPKRPRTKNKASEDTADN